MTREDTSEEKGKPAAEAKPEQVREEKPPALGAEKPGGKPEAKPVDGPPKDQPPKKLKKISRMTLAEVEAELKTVKEKMGGFQSAFAQHLLARKKELTKS